MNAVVAISGSRRSARAAIARCRRGGVLDRRVVVDRHEDVHALGAAGLHRAGEPDVVERLAHEVGDATAIANASPSGGSRSSTRCVTWSGRSARHERGVVLDRALVREPEQRAPVVAQRVRDVALRRLGPARRPSCTQSGVYFGHVLLHERLLAAVHADHRQRPVLEHGDDAVAHRVEVVDEVALGRARRRRTAAGRGS